MVYVRQALRTRMQDVWNGLTGICCRNWGKSIFWPPNLSNIFPSKMGNTTIAKKIPDKKAKTFKSVPFFNVKKYKRSTQRSKSNISIKANAWESKLAVPWHIIDSLYYVPLHSLYRKQRVFILSWLSQMKGREVLALNKALDVSLIIDLGGRRRPPAKQTPVGRGQGSAIMGDHQTIMSHEEVRISFPSQDFLLFFYVLYNTNRYRRWYVHN